MSALPQPIDPELTGYRETPSMILPSAPPRELSAAVDAAAERAEALLAAGRELNFVVAPGGELRVEVLGPGGTVLRAVTPSPAMSIMGGLGRL